MAQIGERTDDVALVKLEVIVPVPTDGTLNNYGAIEAAKGAMRESITVKEGSGEVIGTTKR